MAANPPLGTMIRRARERKRLSQRELAAEKLGVSRSAVNAWERDRARPQSSIGALEQVLGIRLDGTPEPEPELIPVNQWEADTLANPDLPDDVKRAFILDWRRERAAYKARQREGRGTLPTAGRHAAG